MEIKTKYLSFCSFDLLGEPSHLNEFAIMMPI